MRVLGDRLRVVDAKQTLAHHNRLMLAIQCLSHVAKNVVKAREKAQTHADLGMQCAIDVCEQMIGLGDELVAFFQVALLDLGLAVGEEVVGVGGLGGHVFDERVQTENVLFVEGLFVTRLEEVFA
jgi:hypothetical protein